MGVLALKRYTCGKDSDPKHHLSLVSHDDEWLVTANVDLPFEIDDVVFGSSCRGLVYFMCENGKIVVCNLKTREWIVFPLPSYLSASDEVELEACGLGYDPKSGDYKLLRNYIQYYNEEERVGEEVVGWRYLGSKDYTELYSFESGSWKAIRSSDASIMYPCAVYAGGSCYWTACLETNFDGVEDDPCRHRILAFDIATERFSHLSFPRTSTAEGRYACSKVVEYRCSLAALVYGGPDPDDWNCSSPLYINLFVRREDTWQHLFDLKFDHVVRPLGFGKSRDGDGSILFLEGKHNSQTSELMVYDFHSKELKRLGIYEHRSHMIAIYFDFKKYSIPGSTPMAFVDNIVPSSEDVEEMKTDSGRRKKLEC